MTLLPNSLGGGSALDCEKAIQKKIQSHSLFEEVRPPDGSGKLGLIGWALRKTVLLLSEGTGVPSLGKCESHLTGGTKDNSLGKGEKLWRYPAVRQFRQLSSEAGVEAALDMLMVFYDTKGRQVEEQILRRNVVSDRYSE
ncbi:MAG: hypothetical protein QME66_02240 [Candidatus Eisenbacteria bacterium]|nr:hypothetical protein [Candidatus Eisenbacteria bacterium]